MSNTITHSQPDTTNNGAGKEALRDKAEKFVEAATDAVGTTTEQARVHSEKAMEEAQHAIETVQDSAIAAVRKNPTAALIGAVGVGVLLGMALRGRD
ncbi:hypothetical protein MWU54_05735 [Marivita sp. S6314]|uniref:hypothetical protein n=1 Tax=Marivita sp. S6314 TaxID=2926406 RepID=UPI001FF67928|nr:hypothetical protein [Marivita sp. S6314]MCK0149514.1 hypothetical protein [Marivita sp. S6314]